jgi:hypothetical protein
MRVKLIITLVIVFAGLVLALFGQTPAPVTYKPTEIQTLRLQLAQRDAQLAQKDLQEAQTRFQQALVNLTNEANKVKADNKWPADVQFSPNDLTFSAPPPLQPAPAKGDKP